MIELNWRYNEHACAWEGSNGGWQAAIEPNTDMVVYTAYIQAEDETTPMGFAPQSFESLKEAQTWCEQTIYERVQASEQ